MKAIIKKELERVLKDKKMVFSMFILPAVIMIGICAIMSTLVSGLNKKVEAHKSIVYMQNAPEGFKEVVAAAQFDQGAEITYLEAGADTTEIRQQILDSEVDLLVVFDQDFLTKYANYSKSGDSVGEIKLAYNNTSNYSSSAANQFRATVISAYQTMLLQGRIGDLELLNVCNVVDDLIFDEDKANGQFLGTLLPYLLVFMLFASAMGLCVDAIAGEKERGTMASMLLTPTKRTSIIAGKMIGLSILTILSSAVYAVSSVVGMPLAFKGMADEGENIGLNFSMSPVQAIELLAVLISLVLIYVAVLCLISAITKNTKEASTYVMPLYMIVLILGMLTMFNDGMGTPADVMYAIPVYGSALSIQAVMTSEITALKLLFSVAGNLALTVVCVVAVVRAFNSERIMLNA